MPPEVLAKASVCGNEYAWPVDEIFNVIEAARAANLINIGGQLQFRLPDGTCECYWIEVDAFKSVSADLAWKDRVTKMAEEAALQYAALRSRFDFMAEGRRAFEMHLMEYERNGGSLDEVMCFVWYLESDGARDFAD